MHLTALSPDQTAKRPTLAGWPFCLQISDLPESDVERAMGIENVEQSMLRGPMTGIRGETLIGFPLIFNDSPEKGRDYGS